MDPSHGYERNAAQFLAGRGRARDGIGAASVRKWARSLPAHGAILDLGCGSGLPLAQVLIEEGLVVYGVDAAPTLAAAFHRNFPDAPVACEPVETSDFFSRTFDGILAWGLVFLLPPDAQIALLRRAANALAPGGSLLFTAPQSACRWIDALTGCPSQSLGAGTYRETLGALGLELLREYEDEGRNHYYEAVRRGRPAS